MVNWKLGPDTARPRVAELEWENNRIQNVGVRHETLCCRGLMRVLVDAARRLHLQYDIRQCLPSAMSVIFLPPAMDISPIHISDSVPFASVLPASTEASYVKTDDARTIILCFDGTGKKFGDGPTNVIKLYSLFRKDSKKQLCYYQVSVPFICSKSLMYL